MKKILATLSIVCLSAFALGGCLNNAQRLPSLSPQSFTDAPNVSVPPSPAASVAPLSTPTDTPPPDSAAPMTSDVRERAMARDIKWLIGRSDEQRVSEENYKNQKTKGTISVERVTDAELKFAGAPQVFKGDYTGQFTAGQKYPYYQDASAGGKRYYNVKDNFGVWVIFQYQVAIEK